MSKKTVQNPQGCGTMELASETEQGVDYSDIADIDFSELMDLRVDYAFKLCFATGGTGRLVSLLNAIFENKRVPRVVTDLTIANPFLEKASADDKLSVLDIRAELSDGTMVSIEMHLYDLLGHKYKSLRSWARIYGETLRAGAEYAEQSPTVCISFIDGPITDSSGKPIEKIHSLFQVIERDSSETLLDDMELHYIDMKAFVKYFEEVSRTGAELDRFTHWLMVITQRAIKNKEAIRRACHAREEIKEAMKTLSRFSQDVIERHAYERRLDEIHWHNIAVSQSAQKDVIIAEQAATIAEQGAAIEEQAITIADKDAAIAEQAVAIADKDAAIAEQAARIARLEAQLKQ